MRIELLDELSESIKGETDPLIKIINGRGGTATLAPKGAGPKRWNRAGSPREPRSILVTVDVVHDDA